MSLKFSALLGFFSLWLVFWNIFKINVFLGVLHAATYCISTTKSFQRLTDPSPNTYCWLSSCVVITHVNLSWCFVFIDSCLPRCIVARLILSITMGTKSSLKKVIEDNHELLQRQHLLSWLDFHWRTGKSKMLLSKWRWI